MTCYPLWQSFKLTKIQPLNSVSASLSREIRYFLSAECHRPAANNMTTVNLMIFFFSHFSMGKIVQRDECNGLVCKLGMNYQFNSSYFRYSLRVLIGKGAKRSVNQTSPMMDHVFRFHFISFFKKKKNLPLSYSNIHV